MSILTGILHRQVASLMWPFSTDPYIIYSSEDVQSRTFDYIVVGGASLLSHVWSSFRPCLRTQSGGTAGCVVASRLSEDPDVSVLLIERGPIMDTWSSRVPLLSVDFRAASSPTYQWKSTADDLYPSGESMVSGKVFGGTSKVNAHVYTRSVPGEYNAWADAGRKGWDWNTVKPYFTKSEASRTHGHQEHRGLAGNSACSFDAICS